MTGPVNKAEEGGENDEKQHIVNEALHMTAPGLPAKSSNATTPPLLTKPTRAEFHRTI